MLVRI
jgi:uncharacterized DUF497 family protein